MCRVRVCKPKRESLWKGRTQLQRLPKQAEAGVLSKKLWAEEMISNVFKTSFVNNNVFLVEITYPTLRLECSLGQVFPPSVCSAALISPRHQE